MGGTRRGHRVDRDLMAAVGSVLEADRHRQAARHLAMGLALGRARADRRPGDGIGQVLRHEGVEELRRAGETHVVDPDQELAREAQTFVDAA